MQKFYEDLLAGKRPKLVLQAPPQHGKSDTVTDFILWLIGKCPDNKTIYTSFSERLGIRANLKVQRIMTRRIYKKIFPDSRIPGKNNVTMVGQKIRNREMIEIEEHDGSFRNTTVGGAITGESLDLGVIDDPLKGRKEANSETVRNAVWDWFTDDFLSRFSERAGMLIILTRWHIDDPIGRLIIQDKTVKTVTYKAIATEDEKHRLEGEPLFPEHKSLSFLLERKKVMASENWEALYQQSPVQSGGNLFKTTWLKPIKRAIVNEIKFEKYFCTADTALKDKQKNDYTVYSAFGVFEKRIYLLDMYRGKPRSAERESIANSFHDKWNKYPFKGFYIEQKASGVDLFQRMKDNKKMVKEVERNVDKYYRAQTVEPYLEIYGLFYVDDIECIGAFINEYEQFPDAPHDDTVDTVMDAFEITYGKRKSGGIDWDQFK